MAEEVGLKGGQMIAFYFKRTLAHTLVLLSLPAVWWYFSKVLLLVISLNTSAVTWVIRTGVSHIPDPATKRYVEYALKPGEWLSYGVNKALVVVPAEYRDRAEVVVRLRYDPGAWMMITEAAAILLLWWRIWRWHRDWRKLRRWRKLQHLRKEPTFK